MRGVGWLFSPPEADPPEADVPYSIGIWGFGFCLGGEGDGRSETLMQDDDGTYADACGPPQRIYHIGGCPAVSPRMPLGTCRCRGRSPGSGISVPRQRSTAVRDSIRLEVVMGEWSSPMVTTVEPRRGSMALIPVTPGRLASPAKRRCSTHRRSPERGHRIGRGPWKAACHVESMDPPSPG